MQPNMLTTNTRTCDCTQDGYCPRFKREMRGRFREICAGANVDAGTAAAFRAQWAREAGNAVANAMSKLNSNSPNITPPATTAPAKQLLLKSHQAPGDTVALTAAIYSLHLTYPDKYITAVDSQWPEVFAHNPNVVPACAGMTPVVLSYPAIYYSNDRAIHFMQAWCEFMGLALSVQVPLATNRPHLYFTDKQPPVEDFWLVCAGSKLDFTAKQWGGYQEVVNYARGKVRFIQVGAATDNHPRLKGVENMVGKTTLRQLFDLTRRARGVVCGVSLLMHVAAALDKPAIVLAGGREPVAWNAYPQQHYLHTIGALPCQSYRGRAGEACWRSRTVPLGDGCDRANDLCQRPLNGPQVVPECMAMIPPRRVADLVLCYNQFFLKEVAGASKIEVGR